MWLRAAWRGMSSSLGVAIFLLSQLDGRRSLSALRQLRSPEWLRLIGAGLGFFTNFGVRRRDRGPAAPPLASRGLATHRARA